MNEQAVHSAAYAISPSLQICLGLCAIALTVGLLVWLFVKLEPSLAGICSRWFGANWRTTLWGSLNNIAIAISIASTGLLAAYANNDVNSQWWFIISLIPQPVLVKVLFVAGIVKLVSGQLVSRAQKSSEVSGGMVMQTPDGKVAAPAPPAAPPVPE